MPVSNASAIICAQRWLGNKRCQTASRKRLISVAGSEGRGWLLALMDGVVARPNIERSMTMAATRQRGAAVCCASVKESVCHKADSDSNVPSPTGAYIHLPFCKRKCLYCDFPVKAVGDTTRPAVTDAMETYVKQVCREITATSCRPNQQPLQTIFFGGGTPSLIPPELLAVIIDTIRMQYGISDDAEMSMEIDPGTFTKDSLMKYKSLGVTRFSVGVQSFQQELLESIGRSHGISDVRDALATVVEASPQSWSLDLMSGLPHLTMGLWKDSLESAIAARPPHISVYDLQVEEGTPFAKMYTPAEGPLPTEDIGAEMYGLASRMLRAAGYEHYELSNYALPGHRCRHNMMYWTGGDFYAFGLGASSYLDGRRFTRPRKMAAYNAWLEQYVISECGSPGLEQPVDTPEDCLLDMVMLRLRLRDGLDMDEVQARFGADMRKSLESCLKKYEGEGLVHFTDAGSTACLVDPEGLLVSNDILAELFSLVPDEEVDDDA